MVGLRQTVISPSPLGPHFDIVQNGLMSMFVWIWFAIQNIGPHEDILISANGYWGSKNTKAMYISRRECVGISLEIYRD